MIVRAETSESPSRSYALLLQKLHALIAEGKGDSEEADAVREEMEAPGYALTRQEQDRLDGLSIDLYALAEGGPKPLVMAPAERQRWGEEIKQAFSADNWDRLLDLLRRPPSDVPAELVLFMQARCWENLGDRATAFRFVNAAEQLSLNRMNGSSVHYPVAV